MGRGGDQNGCAGGHFWLDDLRRVLKFGGVLMLMRRCRKNLLIGGVAGLLWLLSSPQGSAALPAVRLLDVDYPSEPSELAFNYAPTLVQTADGLLVAWVGASRVDGPDASVYLSRQTGGGWGRPQRVASQTHRKTRIQVACRRPVLFKPTNESLLLFFQSDNERGQRKGYLSTSDDNGVTWLRAKVLPRGITGPAGAKPTELADGDLLCGADTQRAGRVVHVERASAFRKKWEWTRTRDLSYARVHNASEPVLLYHGRGKIQALCRSRRGYMVEGWSDDEGETWGKFGRSILPNPDSGLDVVRSEDGEFVLVYQHSNRERGILNLATTRDGKEWAAAALLENEPGRSFSDPAMIKGADGNLHIVYCQDSRRIKHVVVDPESLSPVTMVGGNWPY